MNINQFNKLADKTKLNSLAICIAKAVMVDCREVTSVAKEYGISRQTIYNYISTVNNAEKEKVKIRGKTYLASHKKSDKIESMLKLP